MNRKEAIEVIQKNWPYGRHQLSEALQTLIPEFQESEDERIKKGIVYLIQRVPEIEWCKADVSIGEVQTWLEKQGEQNIKIIQWKGDNLREVVEFTGKSPKFGEWFKTWDDYESYVHEHNNIFKLFDNDGNHWEVPVGAWIVKTPDGYNVASKAKYKQNIDKKSADKIEPKFEVGDWVVNNNGEPRVFMVEEKGWPDSIIISSLGNQFINTFTLNKQYHLWTIQDAKDGDVLAWDDSNCIAIFSKIENDESFISHGFIGNITGVFEKGYGGHSITNHLHPATKEQRDLLFQKMKEAGYEWDAEKKELKKIEQTLVWSKEDEKMIKEAIRMIAEPGSFFKGTELTEKVVSWLKSLEERYIWKPSGEQIETLEQWLRDSRYKCYHIIDSLYQDLKKLREK